jgi:hypothetical protein
MGRKGTQSSRVWAVVGLGYGLWRIGRRGGGVLIGGVAVRGKMQRCSDGVGWRVAVGGDRKGGRWRHPWGLGSVVWGGARGSGDWGLAWRCSDGEGR